MSQEVVPPQLCFYCPRCKKEIKPSTLGRILQSYKNKEISEKKAIYLLKIAHYRHKHTEYEKKLEEVKRQIELSLGKSVRLWDWNDKVKERLWLFIVACKEKGMGISRDALNWANQEHVRLEQFKLKRKQLKEIFNKESKKLILEDEIESLEVFRDIVGLSDAKRAVIEHFLKPLLFPEKSQKRVVQVGILLYGPPGTGKTIFALSLERLVKRLKGFYKNGIINVEILFERISPSDFLFPLIGETEQRIKAFFDRISENTRKGKAYIIFFDEVEGLFSRRVSWEPSYTRSTIAELLQRVSELNNVLLLGCTNKPWDIDPAALRPGRFGIKIYVPPPSLEETEQLFKLFLRDKKVKDKIDFKKIAHYLHASRPRNYFYSGADIEHICKQAQIFAEKRDGEISMEDLLKAIECVPPSISSSLLKEYEEFKQ